MSMLILKNDTVDTENPHRICLVIFAVHELLGLFLHSSIFSIKNSRFEQIINGALSIV